MGEPRDLCHQIGGDGLGSGQALGKRGSLCVDERLHRLEFSIETGGDQILTLADEEAELVALAPGRELADELQAGIRC
jgi:hypothetical protein